MATVTAAFAAPQLLGGDSSRLTVAGDHLFFHQPHFDANGQRNGQGLWSSDGTTAGTQHVLTPDEVEDVDLLDAEVVRGRLYFTGTDPVLGPGLYWAEGDGPAVRVALDDRFELLTIRNLTHVEGPLFFGTLYFTTEDADGLQLWRHDPASDPVEVLPVLKLRYPSCDGDDTVALHPWGHDLAAFVREDIDGDCSTSDDRVDTLWRTNGRTSDTERVATVNPAGPRDRVVTLGDRLFFMGDDPQGRPAVRELWVSDGTADGTRAMPDAHPSLASNDVTLVATSTHVFFVGNDGSGCSRVWRSDGTIEGTGPVTTRCPNHEVPSLRALGDTVFISLYEEGFGGQGRLYRLVGEPLRVELVDPTLQPTEAAFRAAGGRLYFRAYVSGLGRDLYSTDGTPEGTRMEVDFQEMLTRHDYIEMAGVGSHLAWQGQISAEAPRELWSVPLECLASSETLCLGGGRFQVRSGWDHAPTDMEPLADRAHSIALTPDTAGFTFFDGANVEMAIKVLDGRDLNGHWWVFLASLSNLGFDVEVVDTTTGRSQIYRNSDGQFASFADVEAFADQPSPGDSIATGRDGARMIETAAVPLILERGSGKASSPCVPSAEVLCLDHEPGDRRFRLSASWRDFEDGTGVGTARALTDDTGGFWFFDPHNVELLVKVLDARDTNGHFWVFLGSLSNVEFTLDIEDTQTGERAVYTNPLGAFASFGDVEALPDLP
ncbi:MAG: hypothetical protein AAGE94_13600 [Acidobacteriota bacterium]